MHIQFFGAAREVTGSAFLLHTRGGRLLIDCGAFQGRRAESRIRNEALPGLLSEAEAVVLTHAHLDHSGSLPTLVKRGYRGAIYTTHATRDLCAYMLRDAGRIQEHDAEYLNRKHQDDPNFEPIVPVFDERDAITALRRFVGFGYQHSFEPIPGCTATFLDAGHILGSAQLLLDVREPDGATTRLLFSGDLGRPGMPILRDPEPPPPVDVLVMESTYGDRTHADASGMADDLARVIHDTVARGGRVIVPSFALGRTQELLRVLGELSRAGRLPDVPIFVDSPLATDISAVFKGHPECFDDETNAAITTHGLFEVPRLEFVTEREASIALNHRGGPMIVIAASGMAESGRVVHHLRFGVEDPRNTILIVGFMAQHTLGRRLADRVPELRILGSTYTLRASVVSLHAFSAHADRDTLRWYAATANAKTTFLVHGEPDQQEPLRDFLAAQGRRVIIPSRGESYDLDAPDAP
jgi:metallo-beta-lactamase family protein